jgi:hypothetical protein
MFCPRCRCEYRPGFEQCADCGVPLIDELGHEPPPERKAAAHAERTGPLVDFCGYFSLEEARDARDRLRRERIPSEIAIREAPDSSLDEPAREEFWIRFSASDMKVAQALLGFDEPAETEKFPSDGASRCGSCGAELAAGESFCAHCGNTHG